MAQMLLDDHQREAVALAMAKRKILVAHEPDMGKTRTAIALLERLQGSHLRALIVAPVATHSGVWRRQLKQLLQRDAHILSKCKDLCKEPIVICSYQALTRALEVGWVKDKPEPSLCKGVSWKLGFREGAGHWLISGPERKGWTLVIADEVHEAKNPKSKCHQALRLACERAEYTMGLSGTPINRQEAELEAIKAALTVPKNSKREHIHCAGASIHGAPKATTRYATYDLREMSSEAQTLYNAELRRGKESEGEHLHTCLHRLELIELHPLLYKCSLEKRAPRPGEEKEMVEQGSPYLRALLHILQHREKVLAIVCSPFTRSLRACAAYLSAHVKHVKIFWYVGDMSKEEREASHRAFVEYDGFGVMMLSLKAGGVGVSFVPATVLIFVGLWFTHAALTQAMKRIARRGQVKPLEYWYVGAHGGVLEATRKMQEEDRVVAENILWDQGLNIQKTMWDLISACALIPPTGTRQHNRPESKTGKRKLQVAGQPDADRKAARDRKRQKDTGTSAPLLAAS